MGGKSRGPGVRFAVGRREGPRSNVWRLFTNKGKNDVYVSTWSFADVVKVSLHESGEPGSWRLAFTREHLSGPSPLISPAKNRLMDTWGPPPECAPGFVQALQVLVPSSEVVMPKPPEVRQDRHEKEVHWDPPAGEWVLTSELKQDRYQKEIVWVPRAADGFATCFTVVLSGPEVEEPASWHARAGQHEYLARLIWHAKLPNRMVWLLAHEQPIPEEYREGMEEFRQLCCQIFKSAVGDAAHAALQDQRVFLFAPGANETRSFIDIALPS